MNRCEHGYNCANADCLVMFQNMALSQGAGRNLQSAQQDGRLPGYAQQHAPAPSPTQQQGPPSGYPQQYGHSQLIPIPPRPEPPTYPVNTYYPPNSYIHYAQPFANMPRPHPDMNLPPWTGNGPYSLPPSFPAPRPVEGPPALTPSGSYVPGTQLPGPALYISHNGPHRPWGGGSDYVSQEKVVDDEDFEYDAADDADGENNAFRCLHCRQHCPSLKNLWSVDEDDWAHRQGQTRSEEDLQEAGPVLGSTDHVMFDMEPGSTENRRSYRSKGAGVSSTAGRHLAKPEKKQQTLHRYFTRQKSRLQVPAGKAMSAEKMRALNEDCETSSETANPTTISHGSASSRIHQTPIGQLRSGKSLDQQSSGSFIPLTEEVQSNSRRPLPPNQSRTSARLLWLTGRGHLFHTIEHRLGDSWQRSFEPSTPADKRFVNYVYAHEDQISRAVLKELGIPFYFSEKSHHVVVKTDCNDKLLLELLERTRIKRNYAGQCTLGPLQSIGQSGRGDFVSDRLGSEPAGETERKTGRADTSRIRGGSGDPPEREEPAGHSSEPVPIRACLRRNRDRVAQSTSNIGLSSSRALPPSIDLLHVYTSQRLVPSRQHAQQQTTLEGFTGDPRLSGETVLTYAAALGVNLDPPEYIQPNLHEQPAQTNELLGYRRILCESRKSRPEISHHTRPLPWHLQSNWRQNQSDQASWEDRSDPGRGSEPAVPQARRLNLTSEFSLQCENGYSFSLDSLDQTPYPYYIHVHDTLIAPYFLRELDIPHHWHPSDHRFINITESLSRDMIQMLTLRTSLTYRTRSDLVNSEAAQRQHVGSRNARFAPERPFQEEREDFPPLATHLRGGNRSPLENESLSPLSPRRHPGETAYGYERRRTQAIAEQRHHAHISTDDDADEDDTRLPSSPTTGGTAESAHERNLRRLQRSMETRSHRRDQAELERQRILDPELDSRDTSRNVRQQRRNAVDFGSPPLGLPEEEASWVLEQEAAQTRQDSQRGRTRWRSPRREYGLHGLMNGDGGRPRGGNSGSSSHGHSVTYNGEDEIAPFAMQPGGQEVNLQDVAEFVVLLAPHGAMLHFRREGVDFVLTWFPVDGEEEGRR